MGTEEDLLNENQNEDSYMHPNNENPVLNEDEEMQKAIQASLDGLGGDPGALGLEE